MSRNEQSSSFSSPPPPRSLLPTTSSSSAQLSKPPPPSDLDEETLELLEEDEETRQNRLIQERRKRRAAILSRHSLPSSSPQIISQETKSLSLLKDSSSQLIPKISFVETSLSHGTLKKSTESKALLETSNLKSNLTSSSLLSPSSFHSTTMATTTMTSMTAMTTMETIATTTTTTTKKKVTVTAPSILSNSLCVSRRDSMTPLPLPLPISSPLSSSTSRSITLSHLEDFNETQEFSAADYDTFDERADKESLLLSHEFVPPW